MEVCVRELCEFLEESMTEFIYEGDKEFKIRGFCPFYQLKEYSITWIKTVDTTKLKEVEKYELILLIAPQEMKEISKIKTNIIYCSNPKAVFFKILNHFFRKSPVAEISKRAVVLTTKIGSNVSIGANSYIHEEVVIGNNVIIGNNVCIECPAIIGEDTIIHSGTVIGTDGFGYYEEDGCPYKVPHFGGVVIGKRVEIGANVCIDRGTMEDTYIGDDVKIDNLCHIAHNVKIRDKGMMIALSFLGGSSILEEGVYIAPGSFVMNQVKIGKRSLIGAGTVVVKDVEEHKIVVEVPKKIIREKE